MPEQWGKTSYVERVPDSPDEMIDGVNSYATRVLDVDTTLGKVQPIEDFLGWARVITDANGNKGIGRVNPMPHPDYSWLYAKSAAVRGVAFKQKDVGQGAAIQGGVPVPKVARYKVNRFTLTFRVPGAPARYTILEDQKMPTVGAVAGNVPDEASLQRYVSFDFKPNCDYMTMPNGIMAYVSAPAVGGKQQLVPWGIGKVTAACDIAVKWWWVPESAVPSSTLQSVLGTTLSNQTIESSIGRINSVSFMGQGKGVLLLLAAVLYPDQFTDSNAGRAYHIEYRFKLLETLFGMDANIGPHNSLPYRTTGSPPKISWSEVTPDGVTSALTVDGRHLYDAVDFNNLFRPGS